MKYASEDLKNEHEGVLLGLSILEKMTRKMTAGETVEPGDLTRLVDFLKLFADKCHHGKEEGIFFPAMEKYGIANEGGPIGQMLKEHIQGRAYIAAMAEAVAAVPMDAKAFAAGAAFYVALMRDHIAKENDILFPLGDRALPPELQTELLEAFEEHEEAVMGEGTHEKLHQMLHAFTAKYLS